MPRSKRDSASFNPRLLVALEQGCKTEVRLPCDNAKEAVRCRQEINKLRAALREEGRPGWRNYASAGVYIDKKDPAMVIIKPKLNEYKNALDAAGIPDFVEPEPDQEPTTVPMTDLEQFLAGTKK